jgi:signal transduction histidine kinase
MKNWGLRFEILVSLTLLVAMAAGLMGLVVYTYTQRGMVDLKVETGLVMTRVLEKEMNRDPLSWGDLPSLVAVLAREAAARIVVVDRRGAVLAESEPWPWPGRPKISELELAMSSREAQISVVGVDMLDMANSPALFMATPVFNGLKVTGAVGFQFSLVSLRVAWARMRAIILFFLVLDILAMVVFGTYQLSRRVARPLRRMVDRVDDLASGRYAPQDPAPDRVYEIGRLEESFESMAAQLLDNKRKLEMNLASLREAQEGLIRSEKMATVGRLGAGLAHELGNPLGALSGFVHLLQRPDLPEASRRDFLERMDSEINRMDEIIRSLLDFARPAKTTMAPVEVNSVIHDALALAGVQKWFRGLEVRLSLHDGLPEVMADSNRLIQVLLNLLENAGQAMSGQGVLSVTSGILGRDVHIQVADNGPGLAAGDLEHIFEPFFSLKDTGQGTGLGLTVSQAIVMSFGGRIEVESSPGNGAIFTVRLPMERARGEGE